MGLSSSDVIFTTLFTTRFFPHQSDGDGEGEEGTRGLTQIAEPKLRGEKGVVGTVDSRGDPKAKALVRSVPDQVD